MSNLLKNIYSVSFYDKFSDILGEVIPNFDKQKLSIIINGKEREIDKFEITD